MNLGALPARSALLAGVVVVAVVLSYQLGALSERRATDPEAEASEIAVDNEEDALALVILERDVALAAENTLQERLSHVTGLNADERAELELYRRISQASSPVGLGIDGLRYINSTEDLSARLDLTLVQSRGRDRVSGTVQISLLLAGESLIDIDQSVNGEALEFDLRFFQTLSAPVDLSGLDEPETVRVVVDPEGEQHRSFTEEWPWSRVAE